jgi:hypothetical protein
VRSEQIAAALRMTDSVRWYEWVGKTACGKTVRAQSRSMMKPPLHPLAVTDQRVAPYRKGL